MFSFMPSYCWWLSVFLTCSAQIDLCCRKSEEEKERAKKREGEEGGGGERLKNF